MYQVIARKYRPHTFSELIGQEHVRTTLENAISQQRIAHGYIFAGQRGTGKTTIARILARCLNCVEGPTANPCGKCSSCIETPLSGAPDVIEIDAASNRGINEMRELRENVRYSPSRDRYKVFIIDEAHQITNEAFNALLKTLEEPPEWAVFVLCTTESHKIPTTIGSRCQQFSFRSVDFQEVVSRMEWICGQEGITADPEALAVIAQAGEGSVRDSLSALDQAIACCGDNLGGQAVRDLLGMYSLASLERVTNGLEENSTSAMLDIVAELESAGKNLQHFCRELARYFRNLLVARITGKDTRLIPASGQEQVRMRDVAARFSEEDLTRWLQLTLDIYGQLQYSLQPRLHLELGLMRLVHAGRMKPIEDALRELTAAAPARTAPPAQQPPPAARPQSAQPQPPPVSRAISAPAVSRPAAPPPPPPPPAAARPAAPAGPLKDRLIAELKEIRAGAMTVQAVEDSQLIESPAGVEFIATRAAKMGLMSKDLDRALTKLMGRAVKATITINETAAAPPAARAAEDAGGAEEARQRALAHPDVQKFQEMFPESQVRGVRDLKEYEP
ncbi:MAG: DNA polymerase III subunit gamma/tau [Bryobacterales bacterium]|nr:DNA polymerase III subunit gamma/tau [Bryobacterales bacterium]